MSIDTDYAVLRKVLAEHKPTGWAAEFGIYSGTSLEIIAEHMPVIGFDSFEGLPEDWRPGFPKGAFGVDEQGWSPIPTETPWNAMMVQGWFEDTVPTFPFPRLGLVHIDCDLYSSTVTALEGVLPYIGPGSVVVFDEYKGEGFNDEERAWAEFTSRNLIVSGLIASHEEERAFVISQVPRLGR